MSSLLEVTGLCKDYRMGAATVQVLKGIDLAISPGTTTALVGASGAGKSTLLHILGALDRPSSGRVTYKGQDLFARDWMQMNRNILFALKTEKVVMFIILTLIVLVAAFGIASTLFMVVMEKTRDIAILKTMGARSSSIMKIFVLEGLIIGVIGTVLGVLSGLLISFNLEPIINVVQKVTGKNFFSKEIYYLDHFPSHVVMSDVLIISVTAILISFLATLYPAWQASRMLPAEALRYE